MNREHRRPMVAFILVAIACTVLVVNANQSNARDLLRPDQPSLVAGETSTPPSTVSPVPDVADRPVADEPLVPVAGRTLSRRDVAAVPTPSPTATAGDARPSVDTGVDATTRRDSAPREGRDRGKRNRGPDTAWTRAPHQGTRDKHSRPTGDWFPEDWPAHGWGAGAGSSSGPGGGRGPGGPGQSNGVPHAR